MATTTVFQFVRLFVTVETFVFYFVFTIKSLVCIENPVHIADLSYNLLLILHKK